MFRSIRRLVLLVATVLVPAVSHAALIPDPPRDFLATFTGVQGGDLDVVAADVTYDFTKSTFTFYGAVADAIGKTPDTFYVWGIDRGQGTARFGASAPGVLFDSVLRVNADGSGLVNRLFEGGATAVTNFSAGSFQIAGSTLFATIDAALLPTLGLAPSRYTWNLWPRQTGGFSAISDFAPDTRNEAVTAVPEPSAYVLLGAGLLMMASVVRRRTGGR